MLALPGPGGIVHVTHLSLVDFRSYSTAEVELGSGVTAVVGPNGRGKTNLVEALGYAATLSSHRVATDAPLVRRGAPRAVVRVAVDRGGRSSLVEIEITPGRANRARLNRSPAPRVRDVLGVLRTVLFAPEDLALVKGDPDGRRRFMDDVLVALAPRLAGVQADYERVVRQRSALLRSAGGMRAGAKGRAARRPGRDADLAAHLSTEQESLVSTLDVWDEHLATIGAELLAARLLLLQRIGPHVGRAYAAVSGSSGVPGDEEGQLVLGYRGSLPLLLEVDLSPSASLPPRAVLAQALREQAQASRADELERGITLVGPHRDDLALTLDGLPARGYASHGESWSAALALRLGTWALLRGDPVPVAGDGDAVAAADPDLEPVLVLDDVFAELDTGRRERLARLVAGAEQVIVTAAVPQDVPQVLSGRRLGVTTGADGTVVADQPPPPVPEAASSPVPAPPAGSPTEER